LVPFKSQTEEFVRTNVERSRWHAKALELGAYKLAAEEIGSLGSDGKILSWRTVERVHQNAKKKGHLEDFFKHIEPIADDPDE